MRRDRILWLILILSALLRLWKIDGDLPYVFHYDEPTLVDNAVWMWQGRTLDPQFLNYPTGLIYLLAGLYGLLMFWGTVFGQFANWHAAVAWLSSFTYARPPEGGVLYFYPTIGIPVLYLIGRIVSAAAGVGAVAILYAIARRAGGSIGVARLAALLLAIAPLAVEHSHLVTTDMTATMLATASLLLTIRAGSGGLQQGPESDQGGSPGRTSTGNDGSRGAIKTGSGGSRGKARTDRGGPHERISTAGGKVSDWIKAGILGGLAAGVKYNAGLVVVPLLVLAVWRARSDRTGAIRSLLLAGAAAVVAFLLTTPYAALDVRRFTHDLGYEFRRVGSITASFAGAEAVEATPGEKLAGIFWHNLGLFGIAAVLWGAVAGIRSRSYAKIAVVVWVAVAVLPQLRWWSLYARYLLLAWPAMLLLAVWGIEDAAGRLSPIVARWSPANASAPRTPDASPTQTASGSAVPASSLQELPFAGAPWRPRQIATAALVVLTLSPGVVRLVAREARRARPDPRVEMTAWIEENIPRGSRIVTEPAGAFPSNANFTIDRIDFLGRFAPEDYLARGIRFLGDSGRERLITGKDEFLSVEENLRRIREHADVPWSRGKYAVYFLRGGFPWEEAFDQAIRQKDLSLARGILEEAEQRGEGTPYLYKRLGEICLQSGDTAAAKQAYRQVAHLDTTDVDPLLILADLALRRGDWDGSLRELGSAQRIAPRTPVVFHNLAVTYLYKARERVRTGDHAGALAEWRRALENASICAKTAPGDSTMVAILDQVNRMGRRWGFVGSVAR